MSDWRIYAERFDTADMSGTPRIWQPISFTRQKKIKAIRTWLVYYNSPVFTNLYLDIWSQQGSSPAQKIFTADKTWTGPQISALGYAVKELWFDWNNVIKLKDSTTYYLSLSATGYTGNPNSHLAWVRGVPDPNNAIDITINTQNIARAPFYIGIIDGLC